MLRLNLMYALNKNLNGQSEKVFDGISRGRKKALENWFKDKWIELETTEKIIASIDEDNDTSLYNLLDSRLKQYDDFCELFILDENGVVIKSTCKKHIGNSMKSFPNYSKALSGEKFMYGPYEDPDTMDINFSGKKFFDEVTLLFSIPYLSYFKEKRILIARVLNDDMSNVIQDEDTHVYKDSGDNYLFMINSSRNILPGTAISRSRFEDNTFTKGENLKDGVKTSKWGVVKIKKHTEFEIRFTDPKTKNLHQGVQNTIRKGENLDTWPGYPDYRHIMVGGKGTIIKPPYSDETWGMMCEGDIAEIYNFKSINLRIPAIISIFSAFFIIINLIIYLKMPSFLIVSSILSWALITIVSFIATKKIVVSPLNKTVSILQILAEGEGDLTKRVDKTSYDEIGELSRWFNKFVNNQATMIKRVDTSSKVSKNSIGAVSSLTGEIKQNMKQVSQTVTSLLDVSKNQNNIFQGTKEHFNNLSSSMQQMGSLIEEVTGKVSDTSSEATQANNFSSKVLASINELNSIMTNTLNRITQLKKHSDDITKVVTTISSISEQTQLLSLNASIEAARAGEYGKGFSVVAGEISKLAGETEKATKTIGDLVSNIQNGISDTSSQIESINSSVQDSSSNVNDTIEAFKYILTNINEVDTKMDMLFKITSEENEHVNSLVLNVNKSAEEINKKTARGASSSEESISLLNSTLQNAVNLKQITDNLEYSSDNLLEMVNSFKTA